MDETEELIGLCVRALVPQMSGARGFELHMTRHCALGLTGEPLADFNMLTLGDEPDAESFLVRSIGRARERDLPLAAVMSPRTAPRLASAAARLGLQRLGATPLMVLRPDTPVRASRPVTITRALGPELVRIAGDLVAAAFAAPRDAIARCVDTGVTETAGLESYIAWGEAGPMSAVTLTPSGDSAGITLMATAPEHQRKGMGRALLTQVMAGARARGIGRFYLGATEAGRPLYESLGFETIAHLEAWVLHRANTSAIDQDSADRRADA